MPLVVPQLDDDEVEAALGALNMTKSSIGFVNSTVEDPTVLDAVLGTMDQQVRVQEKLHSGQPLDEDDRATVVSALQHARGVLAQLGGGTNPRVDAAIERIEQLQAKLA